MFLLNEIQTKKNQYPYSMLASQVVGVVLVFEFVDFSPRDFWSWNSSLL
jgi:hypothetical protein